MNPQTIYGEIEKQVLEDLWDNMPSLTRRIVASDAAHRTKLFDTFCERVNNATQYRFDEWAATQTEPETSNAWLVGDEIVAITS